MPSLPFCQTWSSQVPGMKTLQWARREVGLRGSKWRTREAGKSPGFSVPHPQKAVTHHCNEQAHIFRKQANPWDAISNLQFFFHLPGSRPKWCSRRRPPLQRRPWLLQQVDRSPVMHESKGERSEILMKKEGKVKEADHFSIVKEKKNMFPFWADKKKGKKKEKKNFHFSLSLFHTPSTSHTRCVPHPCFFFNSRKNNPVSIVHHLLREWWGSILRFLEQYWL